MGIINQLDISLANLIAAGEVVDRPASVIKELLENSIDAGATDITVEIKNGGITFMRVTDNGCGMSRDDSILCLSRHATSKIKSAEDLDGIMTLGFRGEALAAISSVSKLRIMTRKKEDSTGTVVDCRYGEIVSVNDSGCRLGTTMIIEELFANTPARLKFMKSDRAEGMAIYAVIEKIALSSPKISIKFIQDNVQKMMTVGNGKLYDTIYSVFGKEFSSKLITVNSMSDGISVSGYIGRPDNVRANRNFENFFINSRYVKSRTAQAALEQAFSSYLESEKFPVCILFIDIHPAFVDVNVHPTKLEVKFSNERTVFDAVYIAVKNAVCSDKSRNEMYFEREYIPANATKTLNAFLPVYDRLDSPPSPEQLGIEDITPPKLSNEPLKAIDRIPFEDISTVKSGNNDDFAESEKMPARGAGAPLHSHKEHTSFSDKIISGTTFSPHTALSTPSPSCSASTKDREQTQAKSETECDAEKGNSLISERAIYDSFQKQGFPTVNNITNIKSGKASYKYLGIIFNTYIVIEQDNKMLMIDKHAAHERILFEKMKKNREGAKQFSQMLLLPSRMSFSRVEISCAESYADEIRSLGFDFEIDYPSSCISVTALPGGIEQETAFLLFENIISVISENRGTPGVSKTIYFEKSLYQASCKAAVKGGDDDSEEHLRYIVDTLMNNPEIRYCPHGRPVMFELSQSTIEHKFKRS